MGEQIDKLAQFVAETQWEVIPAAVRQHARLVLLDTPGHPAGAEQPVQQPRNAAGAGWHWREKAGTATRHRPARSGPPERHCWPLDDLCEGHRYVPVRQLQAVPGCWRWASGCRTESATALLGTMSLCARAALTAPPRTPKWSSSSWRAGLQEPACVG